MSDLADDRAALYVLGVLDLEEMRAIRADATQNPTLAAEITAWEQRLLPLAALAGDIPPPETLWIDVANRVAALPPPTAITMAPPQPRRGTPPRVWRATALAAMAAAAGLAALLITNPFAPKPPVFAMVLPAANTAGAFLVELRPDGTLHAAAQGATHAADRDFELWAMPEGATKPLKLGVLPLPAADLRPQLPTGHYKLLVSLEPKGGSPTDLPTGPVVFASAQL
jgi:anti-sigma-K factor RskA